MKQYFMTLSAGLTLFMLPSLYCMGQEDAKKFASFFEIKLVYHKGQPEYESFRREYDTCRDETAITAAQVEASRPCKSTSMMSKNPGSLCSCAYHQWLPSHAAYTQWLSRVHHKSLIKTLKWDGQ